MVSRFEKLDEIRTALKEALGPHLSGDLNLEGSVSKKNIKTLTYSGVFNSPTNQLPQTFVFFKNDVTISYFGKNKNKTKTKNKNKKQKQKQKQKTKNKTKQNKTKTKQKQNKTKQKQITGKS